MPSVLFVVAHDSQFKWAAAAADPFRSADWDIRFFCPIEHSRISDAQLGDAGVDAEEVLNGEAVKHLWYWAQHDAVFFLCPGGISERYIYHFREHLRSIQGKRSIIASAYVGMVIDGHVGGYLYRAASDLICVNSQFDLGIYEVAADDLGISRSNLEVTGLSIVGADVKPQKTGSIRTILFADQVAVPEPVPDRKFLYQSLIEFASRNPDKTVIVKPRHRPDEGSFHKTKYPPETYFKGQVLPGNLRLDYTPISELLPDTDLLLTVSSTAALEAIAAGVRVAILSDVGVREKHGNHMFVGSGLIRTLAQVERDEIGTPDPEWVELYQHVGTEPKQAIFQAVCRKIEEQPKLIEAPVFEARLAFAKDPWGFLPKPRKRSSAGNAQPQAGPVRRGPIRSLARATLPSGVHKRIWRMAKAMKIV